MENDAASKKEESTKETPGTSKPLDRLARLKELKSRRQESRRLNRAEVVEEDRKSKLPGNWENRQMRAEYKLNEIAQRKECDASGKDYDREKLMGMSAVEAETREANKKRKHDPDPGFSTFDEAGSRLYRKLAKNINPDMEEYNRKKEEMGESAFYAGLNTLLPGQVNDTKKNIDNMVNDLLERKKKKKPYSRRRTHDDEKDIDYINENNAKQNRRLEHFYGKYTAEIKQNLERGTAV